MRITDRSKARRGLVRSAVVIVALLLTTLGVLNAGVADAATSGYSYSPPFEGPVCNVVVTSSGVRTGTGTIQQSESWTQTGLPTMYGSPGTVVSYQFLLYQWKQSQSTGTWAWAPTGTALPTVYGQVPSAGGQAQLAFEPTHFVILQHGYYLVLARYRWYANGNLAAEAMGSAGQQTLEQYWAPGSTSGYGSRIVTYCTF